MKKNEREQNQQLNEELEKLSDEDKEAPQAIKKVLVFKSVRAQMLSVDPDAVAQPVAVGEEKGLSGDSSIVLLNFAEDGMYEEKEETPVDVIKAKVDINPVILSKETLDLEDDEIEEKPKLLKRKLKN
ncbi:hypothetical protein TNIN_475431 [Trichonephila inaurata madagascariensis]|uniref:Uncharacterized protein n=1 Tax=Trichonephila inaurata madagascariensis TaxID=2747483 RepID=A0A8X6X8R5_9ARAC|nr:hypothetical protein TNIN_475431 [Trichonephila inaurata madagascariensis]